LGDCLMGTLKFNQWQNPDGTENYKCRAWVNFNGEGTVAIRAAGNVSSITDNGNGDYTANFTNAMPDINYSVSGTASDATNANIFPTTIRPGTALTTSLRFATNANVNGTSLIADHSWIRLVIHR
jgi:hypothetical protein